MSRMTYTWRAGALIVLLLGGTACQFSFVPIDPSTHNLLPPLQHGNPHKKSPQFERNLTVVFQDVTAQDFPTLRKEVATALSRSSDLLAGFKQPTTGAGRKAFVGVLQWRHDPKNNIAHAWVVVFTSGPLDKPYNDEGLVKELLGIGPYVLEGSQITYRYHAQGRGLRATATGQISLSVTLDASSPLEIGGLTTQTDAQGTFQFEGRPSMARIHEKIIVLTDEAGVRIEAIQRDDGKWGVKVLGQKNGVPFETFLLVDGLNH